MIRLRVSVRHPVPDLISRDRLNRMREHGMLTDMAICCNVKTFKCHQFVLSNTSPFVQEIIKMSSTSEYRIPVVMIDKTHENYVESLLQCLYLGSLVIDASILPNFCCLADLFLVNLSVGCVPKNMDLPVADLGMIANHRNDADVINENDRNGVIQAQNDTFVKVHKPGRKRQRKVVVVAANEEENLLPTANENVGTGENPIPRNNPLPETSDGISGTKVTSAGGEMKNKSSNELLRNEEQPQTNSLGVNNEGMNKSTMKLIKRLKKKALGLTFEGSRRTSGEMKVIPRRRKRVVKSPLKNQDEFEFQPPLRKAPRSKQGRSQNSDGDQVNMDICPRDAGPRRSAFVACGEFTKAFAKTFLEHPEFPN